LLNVESSCTVNPTTRTPIRDQKVKRIYSRMMFRLSLSSIGGLYRSRYLLRSIRKGSGRTTTTKRTTSRPNQMRIFLPHSLDESFAVQEGGREKVDAVAASTSCHLAGHQTAC